jgi:hypothetical protein
MGMSLRRDVDVAGVPVQAHHVPELIARLQKRGYPSVAHKLERALSARTVRVEFNAAEREVIVRAVADRPARFSELYEVLIGEIKRRRAERRRARDQAPARSTARGGGTCSWPRVLSKDPLAGSPAVAVARMANGVASWSRD